MYTEQEEIQRKEIIDRYAKRDFKTAIRGLIIGGAFTVTFFLGGIFTSSYRSVNNPFESTRVVKEYRNADNTLSYLQNEKSKLEIIDFESQPENIKPHLEKVLKGRLEITKSLEKAIELTEANMKRLSQESDYIKNKEYIKNLDYVLFGGIVASFTSLFSMVTITPALLQRNRKRRNKELEAHGL